MILVSPQDNSNRTPWNHSLCRNVCNDIHIVLNEIRIPNISESAYQHLQPAGTKMLAQLTRLPPHPNTKRESGDETIIHRLQSDPSLLSNLAYLKTRTLPKIPVVHQ